MIYLGTDHAGYELKEYLKTYLEKQGKQVKDLGAHELNPKDDYPDFILPVAKKISLEKEAVGIVLGASGQGEAIAANSVPHVRAAVFYGGDLELVKLARKHNNANVLSLGARFLTKRKAKQAVDLFLTTPFTNDSRHVRRLAKEDDI